MAYPARMLVKLNSGREKVNWKVRWESAGGRLWKSKMLALVTDQVWVRISRFGFPFPPFDYKSSMGVEGVAFEKCVSCGLLADDWMPSESEQKSIPADPLHSIKNTEWLKSLILDMANPKPFQAL